MMPQNTKESLIRYMEDHCPTGSFLRAVLENDLIESCFRADNFNAPNIIDIVRWCYDNLPLQSCGSPENVREWLTKIT